MHDVFIVMRFYPCEDHYYGYNQALHSVYMTFDEAKACVDAFLVTNTNFSGENGDPFIQIIKMQLGNTEEEIVFDSTIPEKINN
jgi:hypothetical protein